VEKRKKPTLPARLSRGNTRQTLFGIRKTLNWEGEESGLRPRAVRNREWLGHQGGGYGKGNFENRRLGREICAYLEDSSALSLEEETYYE